VAVASSCGLHTEHPFRVQYLVLSGELGAADWLRVAMGDFPTTRGLGIPIRVPVTSPVYLPLVDIFTATIPENNSKGS
jgi:hypothetical protein